MDIKDFVFSKYFFRQLLIATALGIFFIWGSLKMLDLYTLHGRSITVPDLEGLTEEEAAGIIRAKRLRYVVNDSIFNDNLDQGSIAWHDPAPGTEVKRNRTIYLTTVAVLPEMVPMPDLTDLSLRQAISILETHGLTVGQMEYQPDIARDAVLKQKYNEGYIEPGTPVEKGTSIDLVLGEGLGDNVAMVPLVIGMSREDATRLLNRSALNVGEEVFIDGSEVNPKVYMQDPDPIDAAVYMQAGSAVTLYYRSAEEYDFDKYLEQLLSVLVPDLTGMTPEEVMQVLDEKSLELGIEVFESGASRFNARVYRQEPEYQEGMILPMGQSVDVWYRPSGELYE